MRYRPEHKEETHRRILEAAGREFRAHGFEGVGVATLMGALNLTHGGFYAHFADKEELIAQASVVAMNENLQKMLGALETGGFPAVLDYYLSAGHRDHPEAGCLLPTLTSELARHPVGTREVFTARLQHAFNAIAERMPGMTRARKVEKVNVMFAAMVGAVTLARSVTEPDLSESILRATREHLLPFIMGD